MLSHTPDREQVIRRLEAFSDIVIGFSLAQLGLSLVIPAHATDFVQRPLGLVAFVITFAVVVRFWWTHFRIFRHYFEPNRLTITANFIALAGLIVNVFALQLYLYFVPRREGMVAARIYFGLFSFAYGALGLMFVLGLLYRRGALSKPQWRTGWSDVFGIAGTVIGCSLGNALSTNHAANVYVDVSGHREIVATLPVTIFLGTLAGWSAGKIGGWFFTMAHRRVAKATPV